MNENEQEKEVKGRSMNWIKRKKKDLKVRWEN